MVCTHCGTREASVLVQTVVQNHSWDDAQAFIAQLNKSQSKYTYRLPTEAEWENATRAGMPSGFPYSFGTHIRLSSVNQERRAG